MKPLELYIHIPFCIQKCKYCDFLSTLSTVSERKAYVESLCRSIKSYEKLAEAYHIETIFVGGGTPSILEQEQITAIFEAINHTFFVKPDVEITIEINPGTITKEKLYAYQQNGVNRLSIGLQSADNGELKSLGRIHTFEDFVQTFQLARAQRFDNINVDLLSAIPHQTAESYEQTLYKICRMEPEHISAYSLIIEEGTPFFEYYGEGRNENELPSDEEERVMYRRTQEILSDFNYERYEISNYAKPGYACRHNLGYWERAEYLGIGTGAASLISNKRFTEGEPPELLSVQAQMEEFMFLGLRKTKGVSAGTFQEVFGIPIWQIYGDVLGRMAEKGLMCIEKDRIRLSEAGLDISNYVMSDFLF